MWHTQCKQVSGTELCANNQLKSSRNQFESCHWLYEPLSAHPCPPLPLRPCPCFVARDLQNKLFGPLANGCEGAAQFWPVWEWMKGREEEKGRGIERERESERERHRKSGIETGLQNRWKNFAVHAYFAQFTTGFALSSLSLSLSPNNNFASSFQTIFMHSFAWFRGIPCLQR